MRESTEIAERLRQHASRRNRCTSSSSDSAAPRRDYVLPLGHIAQHDPVAHQPNLAIQIIAPSGIINSVAVADIEAVLIAIPPDGVLNEPRKGLRKTWVELPSIDAVGHSCNNVGATAGPITGRPIGMMGVKTAQNAAPVQKVVNQRVDGNHAGADLGP